jgi:hypothetical protein
MKTANIDCTSLKTDIAKSDLESGVDACKFLGITTRYALINKNPQDIAPSRFGVAFRLGAAYLCRNDAIFKECREAMLQSALPLANELNVSPSFIANELSLAICAGRLELVDIIYEKGVYQEGDYYADVTKVLLALYKGNLDEAYGAALGVLGDMAVSEKEYASWANAVICVTAGQYEAAFINLSHYLSAQKKYVETHLSKMARGKETCICSIDFLDLPTAALICLIERMGVRVPEAIRRSDYTDIDWIGAE